MKNNERRHLNSNWRETAELLGLPIDEEPDDDQPDGDLESANDFESEPTPESDSIGAMEAPNNFEEPPKQDDLGETIPEFNASDKEEVVVSDAWSEKPDVDPNDALLSFSMGSEREEQTPDDADSGMDESWNGDTETAVNESESFDAYDDEVEVHIEEFDPDKATEATEATVELGEPETESKPAKKGRKRGRRGKKGKKSAESTNESGAPPTEDSSDDDSRESRRKKKGGKKKKKEDDDDDEDEGIEDWGVPSWDELIASLYTPD